MVPSSLTTAWCLVARLALVVLAARPALAQHPDDGLIPMAHLRRSDATAGSRAERTLLFASLLGPHRPIRSFGATIGARWDSLAASAGVARDTTGTKWIRFEGPAFRGWVNSASAQRRRDGAVWQGRGVTLAGDVAAIARRGIVSVVLRPVAYATQNAAYDPQFGAPNPQFRDPVWGATIDAPYRLGDDPYAALDAGESSVRVDVGAFGGGFSTATEQWGPAHVYPLVLSAEAAGIPRLFVEGRDVPVGVGRASARWMVGALEASPRNHLTPGARSRFVTAVAGAFAPRGLPGLELGGSRFYHLRRAPGIFTWENATFPFSGLFKEDSRDEFIGGANQLASVFARIAPPSAGIEVYGEYYREDHSGDARDLALEPDHQSAYAVGFTRAYRARGEVTALTVEHANGRITHLSRVRAQTPIYIHAPIVEGHTNRGQILGSAALLGGGGTTIELNHVGATRTARYAFSITPGAQTGEAGTLDGVHQGLYTFTVERLRARRSGLAGWTLTVTSAYDLSSAPGVSLGVMLR